MTSAGSGPGDENNRNYKGTGLSRTEFTALNLESKMLLLYELKLLSIKAACATDSSVLLDDEYGFDVDDDDSGEGGENMTDQSSRPSKKQKTTG